MRSVSISYLSPDVKYEELVETQLNVVKCCKGGTVLLSYLGPRPLDLCAFLGSTRVNIEVLDYNTSDNLAGRVKRLPSDTARQHLSSILNFPTYAHLTTG